VTRELAQIDGGGGAPGGSGPVAERSKMRHSGGPSTASLARPVAA